MATNVEKRNEKTRQMMAVMKGGDEPVLSEDNYKLDLTKAMVWYNNNEDDKAKRKWLETYLTKQNQKGLIPTFNKMPDWEIRQLGVLCRMKTLDRYLEQKELNWIQTTIQSLVKQFSEIKEKKKDDVVAIATAVVSIQDRMDETASKHAAEIDGAIDEFTQNKTPFSTKAYLSGNQVAGPIAKRIGEMYVGLSKELREAISGDDDQLVEGYSNFTKRELKKFAEFVDQIIADCNQQVQTAKANRMPRKRKEKPASVQVAKMKYQKELPELGLKSAPMTNIIGSTEVWYYNTKYRRVGCYKAEMGTLSVKGTTIVGFDLVLSKQFTLRKPEEFFKGLTMGKRPLNASLKNLTTKPSVPNGRFNEETILLGAF
jgi:hypothetical protein